MAAEEILAAADFWISILWTLAGMAASAIFLWILWTGVQFIRDLKEYGRDWAGLQRGKLKKAAELEGIDIIRLSEPSKPERMGWADRILQKHKAMKKESKK